MNIRFKNDLLIVSTVKQIFLIAKDELLSKFVLTAIVSFIKPELYPQHFRSMRLISILIIKINKIIKNIL